MFLQRVLLVLFAFSLGNHCFAQTKFEKEYRLKSQDVPSTALQFVESLDFQKKIKWYYEENLKGNSVEAKVKRDGKKYSIEFDTLGQLQDIEVEIKWEEIPKQTGSNIRANLSKEYSFFRINKIQIQYSGDIELLRSLIKNQELAGDFLTRYEIIVKGKRDRKTNLYEITFSKEGGIVDIATIIFRNTDNLEF